MLLSLPLPLLLILVLLLVSSRFRLRLCRTFLQIGSAVGMRALVARWPGCCLPTP